MQLQKLVFLAQGYALAILNEPLYYHDTKAWEYGPVIPQLYKRLKKFGAGVVDCILAADDEICEGSTEESIVHAVWSSFGNFSAATLSRITHEKGSPWDQVWGAGKKFETIPLKLITDYYKESVGPQDVGIA